MGKVNFTTENKSRLEELATKFLFGNLPIHNPYGWPTPDSSG